MIIAHLPAGYLVARSAQAYGAPPAVFWAILLGSIAPDFDMLWFVFVDQGSHHHHGYLTHRPAFWTLPVLAGLALRRPAFIAVGLSAVLHLALDSIVGRIDWGWPLTKATITLVTVPAVQSHWVLNFLLHWTFAVELLVTAIAGILWASANLPGRRPR